MAGCHRAQPRCESPSIFLTRNGFNLQITTCFSPNGLFSPTSSVSAPPEGGAASLFQDGHKRQGAPDPPTRTDSSERLSRNNDDDSELSFANRGRSVTLRDVHTSMRLTTTETSRRNGINGEGDGRRVRGTGDVEGRFWTRVLLVRVYVLTCRQQMLSSCSWFGFIPAVLPLALKWQKQKNTKFTN